MSHVETSKVIVKESQLDCLKLAVACFPELQWMEGQTNYAWYGSWQNDYHGENAAYKNGIDPSEYGKCAHAIKCKDAGYEIGVCKRKDGTYALVWDFWGPGKPINKVIGKGGEKLMVKFQEQYLKKFAKLKGFKMSLPMETANELNGTITV